MPNATQNPMNHLHCLSHSLKRNLVQRPRFFTGGNASEVARSWWEVVLFNAWKDIKQDVTKTWTKSQRKRAMKGQPPIHRCICQARRMQNLEMEGTKGGGNETQTWGSTWPHTFFKHVFKSQLLSTHLTLLNRNAVLKLVVTELHINSFISKNYWR